VKARGGFEVHVVVGLPAAVVEKSGMNISKTELAESSVFVIVKVAVRVRETVSAIKATAAGRREAVTHDTGVTELNGTPTKGKNLFGASCMVLMVIALVLAEIPVAGITKPFSAAANSRDTEIPLGIPLTIPLAIGTVTVNSKVVDAVLPTITGEKVPLPPKLPASVPVTRITFVRGA